MSSLSITSAPTVLIESSSTGGGGGGSGGPSGGPGGSGGGGGSSFSAVNSAANWNIRLYDRFGSPINADYNGYSDFGITNEIVHATERNLSLYLNGLDSCSFAVYLDDPMAFNINRLTSFVKVWRSVPGYSDPANEPTFAGIVTSHQKDGAANIMRVQAYSPLWILQLRFHILNHYLKTNPDTAADYKQSELIWRLIYFISNAFGPTVSFTGIDKGTFYDVASEITMAPYFQPKGSNVWTEIFDGILAKAASVDIIPRYNHTSGNGRLMYLDTALKRGADKSNSIQFTYRTESPSNCDNVTELEQVSPGEFGNYVWAVGQGGPNSGKVAVALDSGVTGEGYGAIGIYMVRKDYQDVKSLGILGSNPPATATHLRANALNDLDRAIVPNLNYEVDMSPAADIYYGKDYVIGDVISLNAEKGALSVSGLKQRIYECILNISDNNVETTQPRISNDFTGKVSGE